MQDFPRGTVTFLFTDIQESVLLWTDYPEEQMKQAYGCHDAILARAARAHGGVVFDRSGGDAVKIAFHSAADAVKASVQAQIELTKANWPIAEPVRVRMALHTCKADPEPAGDSVDYRTPRLGRLGRLLPAAHGGQILLTSAAYGQVKDDQFAGITFRDLGEHRLRDLIPEHIYQVVHPELPDDFPPPRTMEQFTHNLPFLPTSLIGRVTETDEVRGLLRQEGVRLVTLTGPGGTGKTRLAIHVAAGLLEDFPDGVFLVELASLQDAELVPSAIAQALGVREEPDKPVIESLKAWLRDRHVLLVLDTFEHVLGAATFIDDLLSDCPHLKVLVTSRAALGFQGEHQYPVPPLAVPDADARPAAIVESESVRLFVERARAIRYDFVVTPDVALTIALICARLDGLPLAIELAAARIKVFSPANLLDRLVRRLAILTGGARNLPDRQRALRATIAWSYDLLDPTARALFRRLSVFAGGFTFEAAEAVCGSDTLDGISALIDNSLLRQEDRNDETRFFMLDTLREFGWDQLEAEGELNEVQNRHSAFFLALAERTEPRLRGAERTRGLESLDRERDNLRAGLASLRDQGNAEQGLRLVSALWQWWWWRTSLVEGRRWLEEMLALPETAESETHRARALTGLGTLVETQGDHDGAEVFFDRAEAICQRLGDRHGLATSYLFRWLVAFDKEEHERMETLAKASLETFKELDNPWGIALSKAELGIRAMRQAAEQPELLALAEELLEESFKGFDEINDLWGVAIAGGTLANVAFLKAEEAQRQRQREASLSLFFKGKALIDASLERFRRMDDGWGLATFIHSPARAAAAFARSADAGGSVNDAAREWRRSLQLMGYGDALCNRIGAPLRVPFREIVEKNKDAARGYLGDAEYDRIWEKGQNMTRDEAIACAGTLGGTPAMC